MIDNILDGLAGAAGAGGDQLYVEDVFEMIPYKGTGSTQTISTNYIRLLDEGLTGTVLQMDCETLVDASLVPTTLTLNGNAALTTDQSKFGSKSLYTGPATSGSQVQPNHVSAPTDARWTFGTSDFTIEFHLLMTGPTASDSAIICSELPRRNWLVQIVSGNVLSWQSSGGPDYPNFGTLPSYNEWHHIAYVRYNDQLKVYVNGTQQGTTASMSGINLNEISGLQIGSHKTNNLYMDNIRITNGTALYTSNFTPPSSAFAAPSGAVPQLEQAQDSMLWFATRNNVNYTQHVLLDTIRGIQYGVSTAGTTTPTSNGYTDISQLLEHGYKLTWMSGDMNYSGSNYINWIFAKQRKFFDIVTYTGNGSASQQISHNLGSTPGCILVRKYGNTSGINWAVYHRSRGATKALYINSSSNEVTSSNFWNNTSPTDTHFTVGNGSEVNTSGGAYVAYIFAHDAGGFGDSGSESIIKCGSYSGNGSSDGPTVSLGWEPQWLMVKRLGTGDWAILDCMRGIGYNGDSVLLANTSAAEETGNNWVTFQPNGFKLDTDSSQVNGLGSDYIYVAIRRPMKPPTVGTDVFLPVAYSGTNTNNRQIAAGFTPDMATVFFRNLNGQPKHFFIRNLKSGQYLQSQSSAGLSGDGSGPQFDKILNGYQQSSADQYSFNLSGYTYITHLFKRAPGFFDTAFYTGNGTTQNVSHNLGVKPEMIIVKKYSTSNDWRVYHAGTHPTAPEDYWTILNSDAPRYGYVTADHWNRTQPTSSVFTVNGDSEVNATGTKLVALLFASLPGISKVGSYVGNGSATVRNIECGFTTGARFVLIKRADTSTGGWRCYDTARGITSGDDYDTTLNNTAVEDNGEYIDPYSGGFALNSSNDSLNANGSRYIFLAIA